MHDQACCRVEELAHSLGSGWITPYVDRIGYRETLMAGFRLTECRSPDSMVACDRLLRRAVAAKVIFAANATGTQCMNLERRVGDSPPSTQLGESACFGICCPLHQDCVHYYAVETSQPGVPIATCISEGHLYPKFVATNPGTTSR